MANLEQISRECGNFLLWINWKLITPNPAPVETLKLLPESTPAFQFVYISGPVLPDWTTSRQLGYFHIDLAPKNVGWRLATFWATFNLKLGYKFIFGLCSFHLQIVLD